MSDLIATVEETLLTLSKSLPKRPRPASKVQVFLIGKSWIIRYKRSIHFWERLSLDRPDGTIFKDTFHFGMMQDLMDIIRLDWPK